MGERQLDQYNSFSISAVNNFQQGQHSEEHVKKVEVYGQRQMISLPSLKCATSLRKMNPWNLIRTNILEIVLEVSGFQFNICIQKKL